MSLKTADVPRRVLLFTGHMVDRLDREVPRFPATMDGLVARRMFDALRELDAGPRDHGLCGGAAGGDLIFAEACLGWDTPVSVLLPQDEDAFLAESVAPSGTGWEERYRKVVAAAAGLEVMPGDYRPGEGLGLYGRHGRWLLDRALAWGVERLHLVALWDGLPGDGSGGTADVVAAVSEMTDRVSIISPS